jgi:hypothetical protein
MQGGDPIFDVDMHYHRGVLPVGAARGVGVPAGLDQTQERIGGIRHRGALLRFAVPGVAIVVGVIALPVGDQRVAV